MKNKNVIGIIIVIVLLITGFWLLTFRPSGPYTEETLAAFAQCLRDKQVTMYGAEWCPHCQNEKRRFGGAFRYVPYVECPEQTALCIDKGINGYPTWIFPDGRRFEGEMGLERLAEESGCHLQSER